MGTRGQGSVAAGIVALAILAAPGLGGTEDTFKIGFVDLQRVLNQSTRGKEAKAKLEKEGSAKQQEIRARDEEIKKLVADLQKQGAVLSEPARKEREESIRRKDLELRRVIEDFKRDLQKREGELLNEIMREIHKVVAAYAKEHGYTLVLEAQQSGIIYASQAADLTDEVLAGFNRQK